MKILYQRKRNGNKLFIKKLVLPESTLKIQVNDDNCYEIIIDNSSTNPLKRNIKIKSYVR